jgi:RNA polymerase sigma-70 factor (ECF subfamily)
VVLDIAHDLDIESATHAKSLLSRLFGDEPESTATIAVLHYLDGFTWEEVAAEVNMSVSGVRKRARALGERLKSLNSKEVTS